MMITKLASKSSNLKVWALFAILGLGACGAGSIGIAGGTPPQAGTPPNLTPPLIDSFTAIASRTTGVAPLSVFFDATTTTSAITNKPFHKLQYTWNFGDTAGTLIPGGGGTFGWNTGAASTSTCTVTSALPGCRNFATGGVAGHVYEIAGKYVPTLTIYDGASYHSVTLPSITVTDPNTVFTSTTYCVAATTTPIPGSGGCPAGATASMQPNFVVAVNAAIAAGATRILFKRGDTFTDAAQTTITTQGPGLIGSYGPGALPVIQGSFDGTQLVFGAQGFPSVNNCTNPTSCTGVQLADWRVMDLNFIGQATNNTNAIGMDGSFNDLTVLRVSMSQQNNAFGNGDTLLDYYNHNGLCCHHIWTDLTIQDSIISSPQIGTPGNSATWGYGAYLSGDRVSFSGNSIDLVGTASHTESHVLRITYTGQASITNNTLAHPGPTEHAIKLMAPGFPAAWGGQGDTNTYGWCPTGAGCPTVDVAGMGQGYSRWVEISDNQFISGYNNYMVAAAPQNGNSDERIKDVVIERNQFVSTGHSTLSAALYLDGLDITVRNNTFDMVGPLPPANAIYFTERTPLGVVPDDLMAYNNSYYSDYANAGNNINFLQVDSTSSTVDVENTLAYTPNSTSAAFIFGTPNAGSTIVNNSTNSQMMTVNPLYSVTPPVTPSNFKPGASSYAIGTGASVPLWTDFFGLPRIASYDMGAVNH